MQNHATIVVFHGESGCGKTTLIEHLTKTYPQKFIRLVTYTSRLPRKREVNDIDYHFKTVDFFLRDKKLILRNISSEGVFYGAHPADLEKSYPYILAVLRKKGIKKLLEMGHRVLIVKILVSMELKMSRMKARGDDSASVIARVIADNKHDAEEQLDDLDIQKLVLEAHLCLSDKTIKIMEFIS